MGLMNELKKYWNVESLNWKQFRLEIFKKILFLLYFVKICNKTNNTVEIVMRNLRYNLVLNNSVLFYAII